MSSFLNNLIQRHNHVGETVLPRVHGVFESHKVWPTPEFGVDEQTEESTLSNKQENKNLSESTPIKQDDVELNLKPQVRNSLEWPGERKKEKMISPSSITNNIHIKKIENVDQHITSPANKIENKEPVREERKHKERFERTKELDEALAMLENMKAFSHNPNKELQKPDARRVLPDFQLNHVNFSTDQQPGKDSNSSPQPVIKIHIGKIEIKAEKAPTNRLKEEPVSKPALSLDQYLKERKASHE